MKTLVLLGSGEFTDAMSLVDSEISKRMSDSTKSVAIIPIATPQDGGTDWRANTLKTESDMAAESNIWLDNALNHFTDIGLPSRLIDVKTSEDCCNSDFIDQFRQSGWLYFSGGDPRQIYNAFYQTPLLDETIKLYKQGTVIAASSASAMFFSKYVFLNARKFNRGNIPKWTVGCGLIDYAVIPHFDQIPAKAIKYVMLLTPRKVKQKWMGIDENTALVVQDDIYATVMGQGSVHVFRNKQETVYKSGDEFELD